MYSPSRGDARATAPPNAHDLSSSSSMPIDHVPTWQRELYYSRDVRLDRGDRDRFLAGKRDWNSDRVSSAAPFQRSLGLHAVNGNSVGPPNKRRIQGWHNSFYTEAGRYVAAASRGGDPAASFGAIQSLENGLGCKLERDSFHLGTGAPPSNSSLNGAAVGVDYRHNSRETDKSTGESKEVAGSSAAAAAAAATTGQNVHPYQSQALAEAENLSRDRERSTGVLSGWDWSHKLEKEHREKLHSKSDLCSRRSEGSCRFETGGRNRSTGDTELEVSRHDRYGSGHRDSFSGDILSSSRDSCQGTHPWRSRERSSSGSVPRGSPFSTADGSLKHSLIRAHGLDVAGGLSSPQRSPLSALPSGAHDHGLAKEKSHQSPPKRLRLGWGQGLAKYEKKKVGDGEESSLVSGGVGTTVSVDLPEAPVGSDLQPALEQTVVEETSLPPDAKLSTQTRSEPSLLLTKQKSDGVPTASVEQDVVRKQKLDLLLDEAEGSAHDCNTQIDEGIEKVRVEAVASGVVESFLDVSSEQADLLQAAATPVSTKNMVPQDLASVELSTCEQPVTSGPVPETLPEGCLTGWTKEVILHRVEKLEFEIDQIEKEVSSWELDSDGKAVENFPANALPVEIEVVKEYHLKAAEEDNPADVRETCTLSPHSSPAAESISRSSMKPEEDGLVEVLDVRMEVEDKVVEGERCDVAVALLDEEEANKDEEVAIGSQDGERDCELLSTRNHVSRTEASDGQVPASMDNSVDASELKVEAKEELSRTVELEDLQSFADSLIMQNKKQSQNASDLLAHLLTKELAEEGNVQLYHTPVQSPMWQKNVESYSMNHDRIVDKLTQQRHCLKFKERVLTMRFRALKDAWRQEQLGLVQQRDQAKPIRRWEIERRNGAGPPSQRSSLRLRPIQSGLGRGDEELQAMKKLMGEPPADHLRFAQKMPAMILDDKERLFQRFVNTNALVEDPVLLELERKTANPWLPEEKKVFLEKFAIYNKNFSKIAMHLEHKMTADCVEFYYRNQKSEDFKKQQRRHQLKKRRDYSQVSASYLATTAPGSIHHRESSAARVEAFHKATVAAVSAVMVGTKAVRSSIHHRVVDRNRATTSPGDPASLLSVLDNSNKSASMKDKKSTTCKISSITAAVAAVPVLSQTFTEPCGLSLATPPLVKNFHERNPLKNSSGARPSVTQRFQSGQLIVGPKSIRSTHIQQESAKFPAEEMDAQWTDSERYLFTDAVVSYGKDFENISLHVGSKSQIQCKAFFSKSRKRLRLDQLLKQYQTGLDGTAEAALLLQGVEPTWGHMEDTKAGVTEDRKACPSTSKSAASSIKGGTAEGPIVEVEKPGSESFEEESVGITHKEVSRTYYSSAETCGEHGVHENIEDSTLLTCVVKHGSEMGAQATGVNGTVAVEESFTTKEEASTSTSISTGCPFLEPGEQGLKIEQCQEVFATEFVAVSAMSNEERGSKSAKVDGLLPLSKRDRETVVDQAAAALVKISEMLAEHQESLGSPNVTVKPEPGSPQVATSPNTDSACLTPLAAQLASVVFSTTVPTHSAQQFKEKVGRVGTGGEAKPRREPTSWTQEEKDKFAEIIRKHGKDWTHLQGCLPAKSLTQIKTYFQNSKAKLGLVPSDGLTNSAGRVTGSLKRKGDESDTSSNNIGPVAPMDQHMAGSLAPLDIEIASQKINPILVPPPSMGAAMSMGTSSSVAEHLAYALLGGQRMGQTIDQDSASMQKLIHQRCSANGFPPNTPSGLFPFVHHSGLPLFPASGLQRAQHLQQLATSASQKYASPSMSHQKLPSQSTGLVQDNSSSVHHQQAGRQQLQQTAQVLARSQQQLLQNQVVSMMQQRAALRQQQQQQQQQQKQQQETNQVVAHSLQQQVAVLHQQQQHQHLLNEQVIHHQQPQASSQQPQAEVNLAQQVVTQSQQENNPPQQVATQQQQQAFIQHQQLQRAVRQYHQHQQLQQQQDQAHVQAQAQVQARAQVQAHVLAIGQVQAQVQAKAKAAQVHTPMQQHQPAPLHLPLLQPQGSGKSKLLQGIASQPLPQQLRKPLTKIVLQQQQQKLLAKPTLQQQQQLLRGGSHQHRDQQHGQPQAVLRGSLEHSTHSCAVELTNPKVGMVELREGKLRHLHQDELQNQLNEVRQQASLGQQQVMQQHGLAPCSSADAQQQIRPGNLKLFGQSLLSQPSLNAAPQSALCTSTSSVSDQVPLQRPLYPSLSAPSTTLINGDGKDCETLSSAFGRVHPPFMMPDGQKGSWQTLGKQTSTMGLWSMLNGLLGATLTKPSEREARSHTMQETMARMSDCLAQDTQQSEWEQVVGALPLHLQHLEQLQSVQELRRNEGLSKMVPVLCEGGGASCLPLGDVNHNSNRIETNKRSDHAQDHCSTSCIDCNRRNDPSQGLCGADQIDGGRRTEHPQGFSRPLIASNRATSESPGMQEPPSATSSQQMPQAVMNALMAIVDWQTSRSVPVRSTSCSVPQGSLHEPQVWENVFREEANGGTEAVKSNPALGLAASLAAAPYLSGPEVLQQCVRDSGMYFNPQHMLYLAGHAGVNSSALNNSTGLTHSTESQLKRPIPPAPTPFHSHQSRGPSATNEHLHVNSRDSDSTTGGVG